MIRQCAVVICAVTAVACTPITDPRLETAATYTDPSKSGLVPVRPYPNADDLCQVIGENDVTRDMLDHSSLLIGCPAHEVGAIRNRMAEGAERGAHIGAWILLRVTNDL